MDHLPGMSELLDTSCAVVVGKSESEVVGSGTVWEDVA